MKTTEITILLVLIFCPLLLLAQVPVRQVVSGLGNYTEAGGWSASYTVGEAIINTESGTVFTLTQGFQQPDELDLITGTTDRPYKSAQMEVFPNPFSDVVQLKVDGVENHLPLLVWIYSDEGKPILAFRKIVPAEIDLRSLPAGAYLIVVVEESGYVVSSAWVVKK